MNDPILRSKRWTNGIGPLRDSPLFSGVNLLPVSHETNECDPRLDFLAGLDEELGLTLWDPAFFLHVGLVPGTLRLVEHNDMLLRFPAANSVASNIGVQVPYESSIAERILENLYERPIA